MHTHAYMLYLYSINLRISGDLLYLEVEKILHYVYLYICRSSLLNYLKSLSQKFHRPTFNRRVHF